MSYPVNVLADAHQVRMVILQELQHIKSVLDGGKPCLMVTDNTQKTIGWAPEILGASASSGISHVVRRILLDACQQAESVGAGSGELVLAWGVSLADKLIREALAGVDMLRREKFVQDESGSFLKDAQVVARALPKNDLQMVLEQLSGDLGASSMVWQAIQLGGMEGRIFVDGKTSDNSTVEAVEGNVFELAPFPEVLTSQERWEKRLVRVAVIDGIVERVSEIDRILQPASVDREPVVIFARGFQEEVLATLGLNRTRETLDVIPVRVPFDNYSANTLKDIAIISGCNVVSALTGDLISTVKFEELAVLNHVIIEQGKVMIHSDQAKGQVALHIKDLQERRRKSEHEALNELLDDRLRSLTSLSVRIRCSHDKRMIIPEIDLLLRTSRAILRNGVVDLHSWNPPDIFRSPCEDAIGISRIPHDTPVLTALAMVKHGTQAALELLSINAALTVDKDG